MTSLLLFLAVLSMEPTSSMLGDHTYRDEIPTLKTVLGFDFGERITMSYEALSYAEKLADSSGRIQLTKRGKTWENRDMALMVISSPKNLARLDSIRAAYQKLADPRSCDTSCLDSLIADLPTAVLLQNSVHGDEISGTDSGLLLAYHLAAAEGEDIASILDKTVILIELMQNPDGRDRFVTYSRMTRSPEGDPDRRAAERRQPWPGGRYNHYLFDMNRDWIVLSQPETQVKVRNFLEWFPQVVVDLHEMGSDSSFFASNPATPINPLITNGTLKAFSDFGQAIGKAFDARGYDYFQGEIFDSFYPGYGEAWPTLHGAVGLLFEQGSARGLQYQKRDGRLLRHRDAVLHQTVAALAVLEQTRDHHQDYLRLFYQNRKAPLDNYREERQIFLFPGQDPQRLFELGSLLQLQGIEVGMVDEAVKSVNMRDTEDGPAERGDIPAGALVINLNQPSGVLAKTLLWPDLQMDDAFVEEQKRRAMQREDIQIFDITAWSLPLAFGVEAKIAAGNGWKGEGTSDLRPKFYKNIDPQARVWILPYSAKSGQVMSELLQAGIRLNYSQAPIQHHAMQFPTGTLLIDRFDNPENTPKILEKIAEKHQIGIASSNSTWFESGPSLGSPRTKPVSPVKVGMLWGDPMEVQSTGWTRWFMEQYLHYPVTALLVEDIADFKLADFDVILVSSVEKGALNRRLGEKGTTRLKRWVEDGGTLIVIGRALEWASSEDIALVEAEKENRAGTVKTDEKQSEQGPNNMIKPDNEPPAKVHGAFLQVEFKEDHWLACGMREEQAVLVNSNRIWRPQKLDQGTNVGRFGDAEALLRAGFADRETTEAFAHKAFAVVVKKDKGLVVAFSEDPHFRALTRGTFPLLTNAVFFGPAERRD